MSLLTTHSAITNVHVCTRVSLEGFSGPSIYRHVYVADYVFTEKERLIHVDTSIREMDRGEKQIFVKEYNKYEIIKGLNVGYMLSICPQ